MAPGDEDDDHVTLTAPSVITFTDRFNGGVGASDGAVSVHYY